MNEVQKSRKILVCDDDSLIRKSLALLLKPYGDVTSVANTDEAKTLLRKRKYDLFILDIQMRTPTEGLDALPEIRKMESDLPIVVLSGLKDFKTVRDAMKLGANDYLSKDFEPEEFEIALERIFERDRLKKNESQTRFETRTRQERNKFIGSSSRVRELLKLVEKFQKSTANVLITGETGTGKELIAKLLRRETDTGFEPFIAVDSATLHTGTAESILFGHERGAFTGAEHARKGLFEEADGGIIFFDEIANMPLQIQAKLLRALEEKEVTRLGSARPIPLSFRVVSATNRNLEKMAELGEFLPDLLQRLQTLPLELPPLRDRREDLSELCDYLLTKKTGKNIRLSPEAFALLLNYDWPGNVRELSAMLDYSLALTEGATTIEVEDLHPKIRLAKNTTSNGSSFYDQIEKFEKELLSGVYERCEENVSRIAKELDMDRSHLYAKLKLYGIHPKNF